MALRRALDLYSISVLHRPRSIMAKESLVLLRILKIACVRKVFIYNASLLLHLLHSLIMNHLRSRGSVLAS